VFVDGEPVADSDVMKRGDAPKKWSASLTGKHELVLEASNAEDGNDYDCADWLNALVECEP
jgi:alpha-galactosidase